MADRQPWERQEGESEEAFRGFTAYRDQPVPRSLARVSGARMNVQVEWCAIWKWRERAAAWDAHLDRIRLAEKEELVRQNGKELAAEHMRLLKNVRDVAQIEAEKFANVALSSDLPSIKIAELAKLTEIVVKLDRLVRGESTENTSNETKVDLSSASIDALREAQEALEKALRS